MKSNVLVVSLGASPAVVTETLWALERRDEPFWPDRVVIVTTGGARGLDTLAIQSPDGAWRLGPKLTELSLELDRGPFEIAVEFALRQDGERVEDIRDEADATAYGDAIAEVVRKVTADQQTVLHLSIAGGRKTMSYHAGAAMTLYGRPRDELSHVLVSPAELETAPGFWWPSKEPRTEVARSGDQVSVFEDDVAIDLILTPFFRARGYIPADVLARSMDYEQLVRRVNASVTLRPGGVRINLPEKQLVIANIEVGLEPALLALYALILERVQQDLPPISVRALDFIEAPERVRYEELWDRIPGRRPKPTSTNIKQVTIAQSRLSKLNSALTKQLALPELLDRYGIQKEVLGNVEANICRADPSEIEIVYE